MKLSAAMQIVSVAVCFMCAAVFGPSGRSKRLTIADAIEAYGRRPGGWSNTTRIGCLICQTGSVPAA